MRGVRTVLLTVAVLVLAVTTAGAAPRLTPCGTTTRYGQTLRLRVVAGRTTCANVRRLAREPGCTTPDHLRGWACFSTPGGGPALSWLHAGEVFERDPRIGAVALREPYRTSRVTRRAWRRGLARRGDRQSTRSLLLADDLVRCRQPQGLSRRAVLRLLGRPVEADHSGASP